MFIEHKFKKILLAPEERNLANPAFHWQNIALLWSAGRGIIRVSINIRLLRSQRVDCGLCRAVDLGDLCVSVVALPTKTFTTETQRSLRRHRGRHLFISPTDSFT